MTGGADSQSAISNNEPTDSSNEPAATISCAVCQREIPLSAAASREASDYVEHFCGLECYDRWRNRPDDPNRSEGLTDCFVG